LKVIVWVLESKPTVGALAKVLAEGVVLQPQKAALVTEIAPSIVPAANALAG
jgi:hypothetical protein